MKSSRLLVAGVALAGLLQVPQSARAADTTKDQLINLNRDFIEFAQKTKDRQDAQDAKLEKLIELMQKTQESNSQSTAALTATLESLQKNLAQTVGSLSTSLNDQQTKLAAPTAALGSKVDALTQEVTAMEAGIDALNRRLGEQSTKLSDMSSAIRAFVAPPVAPPGAPATTQAPAQPSAEQLWTDAQRDLSSGKKMLAMDELNQYVMLYPKTDNAPRAYFTMGSLYSQAMQYDDAIKAYDVAIANYPEGQWTRDSVFAKATALKNMGRKADAIQEFKEFQIRFPGDERQDSVKVILKELGAAPAASNSKGKQHSR